MRVGCYNMNANDLENATLLEFCNELVHILNLSTSNALRWLRNFDRLQLWGIVNAEFRWRKLFDGLLLSLHDIWQRRVSWFVQTRVDVMSALDGSS